MQHSTDPALSQLSPLKVESAWSMRVSLESAWSMRVTLESAWVALGSLRV